MKPEMGFSKRIQQRPTKGRKPRSWQTIDKLAMRTMGKVGTTREHAFIYLGTDGKRLKVGMTANLERRAIDLGIKMLHSWPVATAGARAVETEVFQIIGHKQGDTEWITDGVTAEAIVSIVPEAFRRVRHWAWVDADLTEAEARQLRIKLSGVDPAGEPTPPRQPRRSIIAFRKAAGTFGHHGGRF